MWWCKCLGRCGGGSGGEAKIWGGLSSTRTDFRRPGSRLITDPQQAPCRQRLSRTYHAVVHMKALVGGPRVELCQLPIRATRVLQCEPVAYFPSTKRIAPLGQRKRDGWAGKCMGGKLHGRASASGGAEIHGGSAGSIVYLSPASSASRTHTRRIRPAPRRCRQSEALRRRYLPARRHGHPPLWHKQTRTVQ